MIRKGRLARLTTLGGMAAGLASDVAGAGVRAATQTRDAAADQLHKRTAERMAAVLGDMKGLPLKFGQLLSYLDDAIPEAHRHHYEDILGTLQNRTPPLSWDEIQPVIETDLGGPVEERFASFDTEPVAAASIGQVYRATLPGGIPVAVKVQYPGVAEAIQADLANVGVLVQSLQTLMRSDFEHILGDITRRLTEECDYELEATNQAAFALAWADDPDVVVPNIFPSHCGRRVLCSEWIEAWDYPTMMAQASDELKSQYGRLLFRFSYRSLYQHRLLNADPHPGNYLFFPDGRIAFIDFGCVQPFTEEQVEGFRTLRFAITDRTVTEHTFRQLAIAHMGLPEDVDTELLALLRRYLTLTYLPVMAEQPWRYTREYTAQLTDLGLEARTTVARVAMRGGLANPDSPGLVFLNRLTFGLTTILANLQAEADWRQALIDDGIDNRS